MDEAYLNIGWISMGTSQPQLSVWDVAYLYCIGHHVNDMGIVTLSFPLPNAPNLEPDEMQPLLSCEFETEHLNASPPSQAYGSLGQPDVIVCPKMAWRQLRIASYAYPLMLLSAFVLTIFIKGFINTDSVKACIYAFLHMHYYLTLAKAV